VKRVYLLQSVACPDQRYIGMTSNVDKRLQEHNSGKSPHTSKYKPWRVAVTVSFEDDGRAVQFEQYLKSGSGHAFANRHLW